MPWVAAAVTVGAGLWGAPQKNKAQKSANKANEARYAQMLDFVGFGWDPNQLTSTGNPTLSAMLAKSFAKAEASLAQQGKTINQAYANATKYALSATASAGQSAYRNVAENQRKALSETEAQLARRGLYSTTVGTGYKNQIRGQAGKAFADISERVGMVRGSLLSGLEQSRASALSAHQGAMANFYVNRAGAQSNLGTSYLNIIGGRNDVAGSTFLDMIGPGGLAGIYAGTKDLMNAWKGDKKAA